MPTTEHATLTGTSLHDDKRIKLPVRVAATSNITLATPGAAIDSVTLNNGDRVLLTAQSTASQNGIYTWNGAAVALIRTADADSATDFVSNFLVAASEGSANNGKLFEFTTTGVITLGSTSLTFSSVAGPGGIDSAQSANTVKAGPTSGGSATPTYRALIAADLAGAPMVASGASHAAGAAPDPGASAGTTKFLREDATWVVPDSGNQSANTVKAGPTSGGSAAPTYRALVAADLASATMGASGGSHAAGAAPDPGASSGITRYLREDATWQVPPGSSGGGGGSTGYVIPIQTQTPSGTGTVTFAVPASFKNIRLTGHCAGTQSATSTPLNLQFNGDTGSNYESVVVFSSSTTGQTPTGPTTSAQFAEIVAATGPANAADVFDLLIPDYGSITFQKSGVSRGTLTRSTTVSANNFIEAFRIYWRSTAAITSITLTLTSGNFVAGSTITLWGESDSAPALLTTNSNLIQETILSAAQATLPITNIAQQYKDLRIVLTARGDTSANTTNLQLQANGDTGTSYDWQGFAGGSSVASASGTSFLCGRVPAATATAAEPGSYTILLAGYSDNGSLRKPITSFGTVVIGNTNLSLDTTAGVWRSTSPVTTLSLSLAAGNFAAGTILRVYGEPVTMGGPSVGTGTRLRISANQSITSATATAILWDTEDNDADNQHFTSAANLTGTVAKTAASATLTGTTTAFLSELTVGQVISVPGTAAEKRVVTAIASNTSLTVNSAFVNTASGQTAARVNSAVVFRQPGFYTLECNIYSAALSAGAVTLAYYLNSLTTATSGTAIGQRDPVFVNASAGYDLVAVRQFQQWDFVEVVWTQNSGGAVNVTADERTHWSISARPTVIVAVPYALIQDQKAQNTAGGGFTSGADQTRTLNTVVSDTSGFTSLASNQITLGPGTYRYSISAPAQAVDRHQAWLHNVTDAVVVQRGTSELATISASVQTRSLIVGRMTITAAKVFEVRHRANTTKGTDGFGVAANFGTEIYTSVEIWKEG